MPKKNTLFSNRRHLGMVEEELEGKNCSRMHEKALFKSPCDGGITRGCERGEIYLV